MNKRDLALLKGIKKGDKTIFTKVYLRYYDRLCNYVYTLSDDGKQAEDIVQETLIKLWEKRETLMIHTSLNAFLYRCVYNTLMDSCAHEKRKRSFIDELRMEAILEVNAEELPEVKERYLQILQELINKLPEKRKEIFILSKFQNYRHKEIASMRNISVRTVENQIRQALISIRKQAAELRITDTTLYFLLVLLTF